MRQIYQAQTLHLRTAQPHGSSCRMGQLGHLRSGNLTSVRFCPHRQRKSNTILCRRRDSLMPPRLNFRKRTVRSRTVQRPLRSRDYRLDEDFRSPGWLAQKQCNDVSKHARDVESTRAWTRVRREIEACHYCLDGCWPTVRVGVITVRSTGRAKRI